MARPKIRGGTRRCHDRYGFCARITTRGEAAEEDAGVRGVAARLGDAEADVVQELPELVQRVDADRVGALLRAAVVDHERALHPHAAGDEVDAHVVHADATVALEPDLARRAVERRSRG